MELLQSKLIASVEFQTPFKSMNTALYWLLDLKAVGHSQPNKHRRLGLPKLLCISINSNSLEMNGFGSNSAGWVANVITVAEHHYDPLIRDGAAWNPNRPAAAREKPQFYPEVGSAAAASNQEQYQYRWTQILLRGRHGMLQVCRYTRLQITCIFSSFPAEKHNTVIHVYSVEQQTPEISQGAFETSQVFTVGWKGRRQHPCNHASAKGNRRSSWYNWGLCGEPMYPSVGLSALWKCLALWSQLTSGFSAKTQTWVAIVFKVQGGLQRDPWGRNTPWRAGATPGKSGGMPVSPSTSMITGILAPILRSCLFKGQGLDLSVWDNTMPQFENRMDTL